MSEQFIMTLQGKKKIEEELDRLVKVDREEVKIALSEARALGDLKENAEYHSAKEKQSLIEGKIIELQHKLNNSKMVDVSLLRGDRIIFGATVTLFDPLKEKSIKYQIVGADEASTTEGKISYTSPLAKALIGKQQGDTVKFQAPKGIIEYEVEEVEFF
jgi:transcription elongation factor GreA